MNPDSRAAQPQDDADQYVMAGDIRTRFRIAGSGSETVLLVHGAGCFIEQWAHTITALQDDYRVCALDVMGSGWSDKPRVPYLSDDFVDFLKAFVDATHLDCFHIVGTSLGGALALRFTELFPEHILSLTLAAPGGMTREVPRMFKILSQLPSVAHYLLYPWSKESFTRRIAGLVYRLDTVDPDFLDRYYELNKDHAYRRAFLQIFKTNFSLQGVNEAMYRPLVDDMAKVKAPTLIIWGRNDRVFRVRDGHLAHERIAGSQLKIIDQCGHMAMVEQPERFNALLTDFLAAQRD